MMCDRVSPVLYAKSLGEALVSGGPMGDSRSALESCSVRRISGMPKSVAAALEGENGSDVCMLPGGKEGGGSPARNTAHSDVCNDIFQCDQLRAISEVSGQ